MTTDILTSRSVTLDVEDSEKSAIHAACESGNLDEVRTALLEGERVVHVFHNGLTPLHSAVLSNSGRASDVIMLLLQNGADINVQTRGDEDTALHLVVENGDFPRDFAIVLVLLENGVDLSVRNRKLRTAYDCAIGKGHFELASTLDGSMPPEQARRFYTEKIGEKYGPYIIAAVLTSDRKKLEEAVRLGGNPNLLNHHGAGAIHYAITHCTLPAMQVMELLANVDVDVNLRDYEGDTALNLAIKSTKLRESGDMQEVVRFLTNCGADPTFKDLDGKDAFDMAEERDYTDVLAILKGPRQSLQRKEAEPQEKALRVEPPSEDAGENERQPDESIPPAEERGTQTEELPDVNAPNAEGLYPIHVAVLRQDPAERQTQIDSLVSRGAAVSKTVSQTGNTALHMCAINNLRDTAVQLLGHHIDYTIKNKEGKTAYDLAKALEHTAVMEAIEEKRKEVQENWKKGKKAGFCAIL